MTNNDINILDELYQRTDTLPDVLHLRAAEPGYEFTEADKKFVLDTYSKLDDILKEVAAFINIKFSGCERHVRAWNDIDFDTKIGPIKIITTDREHIKREWRKGLFDLKSLIKVLRNEAKLMVEESEESLHSKNGNLKISHHNYHGSFVQSDVIKQKRSWLEVLSWIAGIAAALIGLYAVLK